MLSLIALMFADEKFVLPINTNPPPVDPPPPDPDPEDPPPTGTAPTIASVTLSGGATCFVGDTLTATANGITGSPAPTITYQWERTTLGVTGGTAPASVTTAITGANNATYLTTAADEGHALSCEVTVVNAHGTKSASSGTATVLFPNAIYVAPSGNDSTGTGTVSNPYASIARANTAATAAGAKVYLRGGTYAPSSVITWNQSGTAANRKMLLAYPGEVPLIDGVNTPANQSLLTISAAYVTVRGLDVRNAKRTGISGWNGNNLLIQRCRVRDSVRGGIFFGGDTITSAFSNVIDGCEVTNCVRENVSKNSASGWAQAIGMYASDNSIVRNTKSYKNWGEGIACQSSMNVQFLDNVLYDNFSINIYFDNGQGGQAHGNLIYHTYDTNFYRNNREAYGVRLANEFVDRPLPSQDIVVTNNIFAGVRDVGYGDYEANTGMVNCTLSPNTIYATPEVVWPA